MIALPLTIILLRTFARKPIEELWEWTLTPLDRDDLDRGKLTQLHLSD